MWSLAFAGPDDAGHPDVPPFHLGRGTFSRRIAVLLLLAGFLPSWSLGMAGSARRTVCNWAGSRLKVPEPSPYRVGSSGEQRRASFLDHRSPSLPILHSADLPDRHLFITSLPIDCAELSSGGFHGVLQCAAPWTDAGNLSPTRDSSRPIPGSLVPVSTSLAVRAVCLGRLPARQRVAGTVLQQAGFHRTIAAEDCELWVRT